MSKHQMAKRLAAALMGVTPAMVPDSHKEYRAYMRLTKAELELKCRNLPNAQGHVRPCSEAEGA